jgi:predicted metal-dependent RNase
MIDRAITTSNWAVSQPLCKNAFTSESFDADHMNAALDAIVIAEPGWEYNCFVNNLFWSQAYGWSTPVSATIPRKDINNLIHICQISCEGNYTSVAGTIVHEAMHIATGKGQADEQHIKNVTLQNCGGAQI